MVAPEVLQRTCTVTVFENVPPLGEIKGVETVETGVGVGVGVPVGVGVGVGVEVGVGVGVAVGAGVGVGVGVTEALNAW